MMSKKIVVSVLVAIFLMVCLVNPAIAQASTDAVLILHFDEGSGTVAKDESGYGNDGTIQGATWVDGISGKALSFDGVDDYVEAPFPTQLIGDKPFTVSFWMKYIPQQSRIWIMDIGDRITPTYRDVHFLINKNTQGGLAKGVTEFGFWNGVQNQVDISTHQNKGVFVAATYDPVTNMLKLYLNGNLVDEDAVPEGKVNLQPENVKIGSSPLGGESYFNGVIDEVAIYNRALSAEEIKAQYLAKRAGGSTEESASALINSVSNRIDTLKLNDASTSAIEESLKKAQSAYDIGNYDEAYELALSAQKMADDAYEMQQHIKSAQSEIDESGHTSPEVKDVETKTKEAKDTGQFWTMIIVILLFMAGFGCMGYLLVKKGPFDKSFKKSENESIDDLTTVLFKKCIKAVKKVRTVEDAKLCSEYISTIMAPFDRRISQFHLNEWRLFEENLARAVDFRLSRALSKSEVMLGKLEFENDKNERIKNWKESTIRLLENDLAWIKKKENEEKSEERGVEEIQKYVDNCITLQYSEIVDERVWDSVPEIHDLGDGSKLSGDEKKKLAESLVSKYSDLDYLYSWRAIFYKRKENYEKAKTVLIEGLEISKRKYNLYMELGETEYYSNNILEAVRWWIQSILSQKSIGMTDRASYNSFLYLAYICKRLDISHIELELLKEVDSRAYGQIRLTDIEANNIYSLVDQEDKSDLIRKALSALYDRFY
jgi:hypothetical protein